MPEADERGGGGAMGLALDPGAPPVADDEGFGAPPGDAWGAFKTLAAAGNEAFEGAEEGVPNILMALQIRW